MSWSIVAFCMLQQLNPDTSTPRKQIAAQLLVTLLHFDIVSQRRIYRGPWTWAWTSSGRYCPNCKSLGLRRATATARHAPGARPRHFPTSISSRSQNPTTCRRPSIRRPTRSPPEIVRPRLKWLKVYPAYHHSGRAFSGSFRPFSRADLFATPGSPPHGRPVRGLAKAAVAGRRLVPANPSHPWKAQGNGSLSTFVFPDDSTALLRISIIPYPCVYSVNVTPHMSLHNDSARKSQKTDGDWDCRVMMTMRLRSGLRWVWNRGCGTLEGLQRGEEWRFWNVGQIYQLTRKCLWLDSVDFVTYKACLALYNNHWLKYFSSHGVMNYRDWKDEIYGNYNERTRFGSPQRPPSDFSGDGGWKLSSKQVKIICHIFLFVQKPFSLDKFAQYWRHDNNRYIEPSSTNNLIWGNFLSRFVSIMVSGYVILPCCNLFHMNS
jgi:hypothetical protein